MTDPAVTAAYTTSFVGLLVGIGIALKLLSEETVDNATGQFKWLLVIPGFAAISYLLMVLEVGVVTVGENEVYLFRYIDWIVTTPILVGYAGYVAGAPRKWIVGVGLADALMIATGLAATLVTGIGTWIGFGVSAGFHLALLAILYLVFPRYVSENPERRRLFRILQNHVGLLWIAYPVIWIASSAGVGYVSVTGTAMIIAYLDVVAKTPYVYFVYRERTAFGTEPLAADSGSTESESTDTPAASADPS